MAAADNDTEAQAWALLADLFLDTERDERQTALVAERLAALPYSVAELEAMLRRDVAPAFGWNLFDIAGEWEGWSGGEARIIVSRYRNRNLVSRRFADWQGRRALQAIWPDWLTLAARLSRSTTFEAV